MGLREGDIEAIRNKMKDTGRPIKSKMVRHKDRQYYYKTDKRGNVRIKDVIR